MSLNRYICNSPQRYHLGQPSQRQQQDHRCFCLNSSQYVTLPRNRSQVVVLSKYLATTPTTSSSLRATFRSRSPRTVLSTRTSAFSLSIRSSPSPATPAPLLPSLALRSSPPSSRAPTLFSLWTTRSSPSLLLPTRPFSRFSLLSGCQLFPAGCCSPEPRSQRNRRLLD